MKNFARNPPPRPPFEGIPDPSNSSCLGPLFPSKYRKMPKIKKKKSGEGGGLRGPQILYAEILRVLYLHLICEKGLQHTYNPVALDVCNCSANCAQRSQVRLQLCLHEDDHPFRVFGLRLLHDLLPGGAQNLAVELCLLGCLHSVKRHLAWLLWGIVHVADLVAPYRAILRYYRCDTPYRAILFQGG